MPCPKMKLPAAKTSASSVESLQGIQAKANKEQYKNQILRVQLKYNECI
jgi:hypothetical protein